MFTSLQVSCIPHTTLYFLHLINDGDGGGYGGELLVAPPLGDLLCEHDRGRGSAHPHSSRSTPSCQPQVRRAALQV